MKEQRNFTQKKRPALVAAELLQMEPKAAEKVFNKAPLERKVAIVRSTPLAERQKLLFLAENAKELVQALPEEEVYWTVKQIGANDALAIVALTSQKQFQYIIDVDCWQKDRIDIAKIYTWLKLLGRCNAPKVLEWLTKTDQEFLNFACKKLFRVYKIDEDMDLAEISEKLPSFTLDGIYYFEFLNNDARLIATPLLNLLYQKNPQRFYSIMEGAIWDSETLLEEDALFWRQSRIGEKGFPQLEEALEVYQYLEPEAIESLLKNRKSSETSPAVNHVHDLSLRYPFAIGEASLFLDSLFTLITSQEVFDRVQRDIMHLTNKIIMADCLEMRELKDLKKSVRKAMGYINIGIELLSEQKTGRAGKLLEDIPPVFLFQAGYTQALKLSMRIKTNLRDQWSGNPELRKSFFDTPWGETITGLERNRPLFFKGIIKTGALEYRDFERLEEITATGQVLDIVELIEKLLFNCFAIDYDYLMGSFFKGITLNDRQEIKASSVFLTVLANRILREETKLLPLSEQDLPDLFSKIFEKKAAHHGKDWVLKEALYSDTVSWICEQYSFEAGQRQLLGTFVQAALDGLQGECSSLVAKSRIDIRYISTLLFKQKRSVSEKMQYFSDRPDGKQ